MRHMIYLNLSLHIRLIFFALFSPKPLLVLLIESYLSREMIEFYFESSNLHVDITFWYLPESMEKIYLYLNDSHK